MILLVGFQIGRVTSFDLLFIFGQLFQLFLDVEDLIRPKLNLVLHVLSQLGGFCDHYLLFEVVHALILQVQLSFHPFYFFFNQRIPCVVQIGNLFRDHELLYFVMQLFDFFLQPLVLGCEIGADAIIFPWTEVLQSFLDLFAVQDSGVFGVIEFRHGNLR